jgi:hypothetical protein
MSDNDPNSRRQFLRLTGATMVASGLAGCSDGGNGATPTSEDGGNGATPTSEDGENGATPTSGDGENGATPTSGDGENGGTPTSGDGVPESERTATSLGGQQRDPDNLVAPSQLNYQEEPNGDQQCSNCQFYVTDQNGDGMGACTLISGQVSPQGWCTSYTRHEE